MFKTLTFIRHNAIALLALFIALGGTSYAALSLPASSVGTRQLRKHSVTGRKLAKHAVGAANLDPRSIAGHIADWAAIREGQVAASSSQGNVTVPDPGQGVYRVSWQRRIPARCVAIVSPVNDTTFAQVTADVVGPLGTGSSMFFTVETFDTQGNNVPANFNVLVVCP